MSRRRGGLFLPLDVNFMDDELIALVGEKPAWLYLAMCLRSKSLRSDGVLTGTQVERLNVPGWKTRLHKLCTTVDRHGRSLILDITEETDVSGRYWITGWDGHNDRAEVIEERLGKDAARKRSERAKGDPCPNPVRTMSGPVVDVSKEIEEVDADLLSDPPPPGSDSLAAAREELAKKVNSRRSA